MEQAIIQSPAKDKFLASIEDHISALLDIAPASFEAAQISLDDIDFPTTRTEDWKYTRTARISNEQWHISEKAEHVDIKPYLIPGLDAEVVVFINGIFRNDLSTHSSSNSISIATKWNEENPQVLFNNIFQALNAAYSTAALKISIAKNEVAPKTLHILHVADEEKVMAQPTLFIHAGKSSQLHIVESFVSVNEKRSFTNRTLNITVEENAQVHLDKIQLEGDEHFLLNEDNVKIKDNAQFTINTLTVDGGWIRNSLNLSLDGKNIDANLNGFYLPRRKQFVDNHTRVDHQQPHSNSNELYKGILNDQSTGVFNGKVYVRPDAQKTNAFQSNANILLSDEAQINTKPELEIYADDVKCSHGTTTGQMDENALFYLKSRGLGDENARRLLSTAFINDVLNKVENGSIRSYVTEELVKRELLFT